MSAHRFAVLAATAAAIALPILSATSATAVPATATPAVSAASCPGNPYLPWAVHGTTAVNIRSKATTNSTAVGVLYKSHKFTVHSYTTSWVNITDTTTGVRGYVSATYVFRDVRICTD